MSDEQVIIRCEGLTDRIIPASLVGGWPLPDLLAHFPISDVWIVPTEETMPLLDRSIIGFYRKTNESQVTDEQIVGMKNIMRGAQYVREPSEDEDLITAEAISDGTSRLITDVTGEAA